MIVSFNHSPQSNRLLASILHDAFSVLMGNVEQVFLQKGEVLEVPGKAIEHVYFPGHAVVSVISLTSAGTRLETGLIGPEGMTGLAVLNGVDRSPNETVVQIPGRAWRISSVVFRKVLEANRPLHDHLLRYAQVFLIQVGQAALSNSCFKVEKRVGRWLLMCHDRVDREDLAVTHELLSTALGVRRAGVTEALRHIVSQGAVKMSRGRLYISDRTLLLQMAEEAYGVPEAEYERVMGPSSLQLARAYQ